MLIVLTTKWHHGTMSRWLKHFNTSLKNEILLFSYEQCSGKMPAGNYLFTDLERISENAKRFQQIIHFSQKIKAAGYQVINDPAKALMRYDLQKAVMSEFKTYRLNEDYSQIRFPVFVRLEHDHKAVSDLLYTLDELNQVVKKTQDVLICEFEDISDNNKLYHKYSAFMINGKIIPRHMIFSYQWIVKEPDVETAETLKQEYDYCRENPHEPQIRDIFTLAKIEYGRIDYSMVNNSIKVWEINTNPNLNPLSTGNNKIRNELFNVSAKAMNIEFNVLANTVINSPYIQAPFYLRGYFEKMIKRVTK